MTLPKCPVCYDELSPPIFQCFNGHIICKECLERLEQNRSKECPTCRVSMTQRIRCLVADESCRVKLFRCSEDHTSASSAAERRRPTPYERTAPPLLPKPALASARRFTLAACPRNESIMMIEVRKVSDEALVCFGDGGATFQVLVERPQVPAWFGRFLKSRHALPKSINDLRDAGLKIYPSAGKLCIYEASDTKHQLNSVDLLREMANDLEKPYALQHISLAQAKLFEDQPPHAKKWITLVVTSLPSRIVIHFEGDHQYYSQRMAAYAINGIYDTETNNYVRGLSFDPSDYSETRTVTMALEQVFRSVAMKARFRQPLPALNTPADVFLARLREWRNLFFVD